MLLLLLAALVEAGSLAAIALLKSAKGIEYGPLSTTQLPPEHRRSLERLVSGEAPYYCFSPELGWGIKSNGRVSLYRANSQGIRGDRDYTRALPQDSLRISTFGDSFTHCNDVVNADTWQSQLQEMHPGLEVINFGVSAFGLDQALLRYRHQGREFASDIVFIGYMSENIQRHINVYRPFYAAAAFTIETPLAKPRFVAESDTLRLLPNPMTGLESYRELLRRPAEMLHELGRNDCYFQNKYHRGAGDVLASVRCFKMFRYELALRLDDSIRLYERGFYYNSESEAFAVTVGLFDAFVAEALREGALPLIVILPSRADLLRYREQGTVVYEPLLRHLERRGHPCVDLMDAFQAYGGEHSIEELFIWHYAPLGNEIVARFLLEELQRRGLLERRAVRQRVATLTATRDASSSADPGS